MKSSVLRIISFYIYLLFSQNASKKSSDENNFSGFNISSIIVLVFMMFLVLFAVHCTWVSHSAYSSPSVVLASSNPDG